MQYDRIGELIQMEFSNEVSALYKQLLSKEWRGKYIWEHIRDLDLSAAPAFKGNAYDKGNQIKIMIVGRAVNGWQVKYGSCNTCDETVNEILRQDNRLDDFAKDYVIDEVTNKKYYYAKSAFLRLMKALVWASNGNDENWQQRIIWSNLFKIAPRNGNKNPSWLMIRNDIHIYSEILKYEILNSTPDLVVFVTDESFMIPYRNNDKYGDFLGLFSKKSIAYDDLPEDISFVGKFIENEETNMIVCKRPECRSVSRMAEEIIKEYERLKNDITK